MNEEAMPQLPDPVPERTLGHPGKRFNIPGDVVTVATSNLPDEQRNAIRWLHSYATSSDLPVADLAGKLKRADGKAYDPNTLYKVFTGRHEAKLDNICDSIVEFRKLVEQRGTITRMGFVETSLSKKMWKVCESALIYQKIAFIFGESQIGKTSALEAFAKANNHNTIYVRMPAGGRAGRFLHELANARGINTNLKLGEITNRLMRAFDDSMLLLVDEAHLVFGAYDQTATLDLIREIHDRSKCGLVICATNVFGEEMARGKEKQLLKQFDLRKLCSLQLPDRPSKRDLDTIGKAYGLPAPEDEALKLQSETVKHHGLGRWCTILQAASRLASKSGKPLAWVHVIAAHAALCQLERIKEVE